MDKAKELQNLILDWCEKNDKYIQITSIEVNIYQTIIEFYDVNNLPSRKIITLNNEKEIS